VPIATSASPLPSSMPPFVPAGSGRDSPDHRVDATNALDFPNLSVHLLSLGCATSIIALKKRFASTFTARTQIYSLALNS
jgi:hypothetical protein